MTRTELREKIRHIQGHCHCKDDDPKCWYTSNAQDIADDNEVARRQDSAIDHLIDEYVAGVIGKNGKLKRGKNAYFHNTDGYVEGYTTWPIDAGRARNNLRNEQRRRAGIGEKE